jgi:hypothetical protein
VKGIQNGFAWAFSGISLVFDPLINTDMRRRNKGRLRGNKGGRVIDEFGRDDPQSVNFAELHAQSGSDRNIGGFSEKPILSGRFSSSDRSSFRCCVKLPGDPETLPA